MGFFDFIKVLSNEAYDAGRVVVGVVGFFAILVLSFKGGFSLARCIIAIVTIALLLACLFNLNALVGRVEVDVKKEAGPAVTRTYEPSGPKVALDQRVA